MIEDVMTIAGDAYRDATRRKGIVYLLLLIAVAQVSVFSLYDEISLGIANKMLTDAGLAMVFLVGIISAMSVAFQVPKELRDRTAMTLFAKPMGRESYLVGKVVGISWLALRNMGLVGLGILLVFGFKNMGDESLVVGFLQSLLLAFVAAVDFIAIALLLSLFLSEGAVAIAMLVILVVGSASYSWSVSQSSLASVASLVKYILPNLYLLDIKSEVAAGLKTSGSYLALSAGYGLSYAVMLTCLSISIFKRRDL
jgi:ABC-type transport system involved in multi-copper enzyme maturation permease subunit